MVKRNFQILILVFLLSQGFGLATISVKSITKYQNHNAVQSQDVIFGNYSYQHASTNNHYCSPSIEIDTYSSNDIDSVWVVYTRVNESIGQNQSMTYLQNNRYYSSFNVYVTETYTDYTIKFYANDTVGTHFESEAFSLRIVYNPPDTPGQPDYLFYLIIGTIIVVPTLGIVRWISIRKRESVS